MPHWRPSHLPDCTRPAPIESRTSGGKRLAKCPDCSRYWFPDARPESSDGQPEPETSAPMKTFAQTFAPKPTARALPSSRHVCPEHYAPVRPDGRGCEPCALDVLGHHVGSGEPG